MVSPVGASKQPSEQVLATYKEMHANYVNMGNTVLKLVRHPEATQEQLWEIHTKYSDVYKSLFEARQKLREIYPRSPLWRDYPWNTLPL